MRKLTLLFIAGFCATLLAQRFVRTANDIYELVASNPSNIHTNVLVLGLTNVNDGQGGAFSWVSNSSAATNGWDCFQSLTSTNGRWIRKAYSSGTNYNSVSYITNLYTTVNVSSNLYVTNLFVTNIYGGGIGELSTYYRTAGSGANFQFSIATDTYEQVIFGTSGPAFTITNTGTYLIALPIACTGAASFPQTYYITNVTAGTHVAGPFSTFVTSTDTNSYPAMFTFMLPLASAPATFQVWGKTSDTTYTNGGVIATNTILSVIRLGD